MKSNNAKKRPLGFFSSMTANAKRRRFDPTREDRISNLPENLKDCILEHLSISDAARTAVLSKTWRYIWLMHQQVILDQHFCQQVVSKKCLINQRQIKYYKVVGSIFSMHRAPILKFHLFIPWYAYLRYPSLESPLDAPSWIMKRILKNGVRNLNLTNSEKSACEMPSSLFDCSTLTELKLTEWILNAPHGFDGFPKLTVVSLVNVVIIADMSFGTALEELHLIDCSGIEHLRCHFANGNSLRKLVISNSKNIDCQWFEYAKELKEFHLSLYRNSYAKGSLNLDKLLGSMPSTCSLRLDGFSLESLEPVPCTSKRLTKIMKNLKILVLNSIDLYDLCQLSSALCVIRCSPDLQKLLTTLVEKRTKYMDRSAESYLKSLDFTDMILDQLQTVEISGMIGSKIELYLIKVLLASSSLLGMIEISGVIKDADKKSRIAQELMSFPRNSSATQIIWN